MNVIYFQLEGTELVLVLGNPEDEDECDPVAVFLAEPKPELLAA